MCPLVPAASITVENLIPFKGRIKYIHHGMLNNAVPYRRGGYNPFLWVMDTELVVWSGYICTPD
ncbi:hypothetical protein K7I13_05640 [Brucepastera parasyntrophica]|uniref:hypothetical protein n=1 Tax=Brucepastera parasyntrophica TaxID=2880008 RepID=UPI00210F203B|nr:hypothetical protein [Brucepastera parasyntrophica]ULQ61238.1 hypothetical protein K7I13_05640 [Brucepastera parasyntrophica]